MCAAFPPLDAIPTSREKLWSGRSRKRASPTGGMGRDWAAVASTKRGSPHATRPGETMRSGLTPTTWTLWSFGEASGVGRRGAPWPSRCNHVRRNTVVALSSASHCRRPHDRRLRDRSPNRPGGQSRAQAPRWTAPGYKRTLGVRRGSGNRAIPLTLGFPQRKREHSLGPDRCRATSSPQS